MKMAALKPFADLADWIDANRPEYANPSMELQIENWPYTLGVDQLYDAREALATAPEPAGVSEEELSHLRQTVEYLTGVPAPSGVINDYRAPEVDQAILRCRERGDNDTAHVLAQMRLVYRRQSNELQDAQAALASPSPDTPEIEGRGQ